MTIAASRHAEHDTPSFDDVLAARDRIRPYLLETALHRYPALDELVGTEVWHKHENHQPVGAFKARGAVNLIAQLDERDRARGVACASTGNHGQSIAFAAQVFGVRATVFVPEAANPVKVDAIRGWGAEIVETGVDYDEAREACERHATEHGVRYIHSGNEPDLIAGVGTITLEILERRPDIEVVIVPVGGGSGAAGACIVAKAQERPVDVIAVQSELAPAAWRSWKEGRLVEDRMGTIAEGLATRTAFELPQRIMRTHLDDFVLVPDEALLEATRTYLSAARNLIEPSGAAPLAAALRLKDRLARRRVALICSGGNLSPDQLRTWLA
ncbi:MAG TPA: threonine/serine dehydratase [Actinomycetota bacterium]|nr:threonine/serine dehydratase [Actinomycetota bacterium]